ncbi:hypothetical protein ACOJUR_10425 [Alicyclobacillus tolerans]|uniref:hypothetical protein n=1 Tax=Alicyclobacillus tolerans TaxID=90970 RepID=UPI003B7EDF3B
MMYDVNIQKRLIFHGFTLLEIMVWLCVVSLFSFLAIPKMLNTFNHVLLENNLFKLSDILSESQLLATENKKPVIFTFAPFSAEYWIYQNGPIQGWTPLDPGVSYRDGILSLYSNRIIYKADGSSTIAGVIRLKAGNSTGNVNLYMGSGLAVNPDGAL